MTQAAPDNKQARAPEPDEAPADHDRSAERRQAILLAFVLLAVGGLAWSFQLRAPLAVDPTPLDGLPQRIGSWSARDVPLDSTVEDILRADHNVQRAYLHPVGDRIGVYIGYYGTERGGRPEHTPWVCYPNAGWNIETSRVLTLDPERGLRVHEMLVEKNGNLALVHFWYRSFRSTGLLGATDQVWDRFLGRLQHDRADGALVRISTPLTASGDEPAASARLSGFGARLDGLLADHWPREHPVDG